MPNINNLKPIVNLNGFLVNCYLLVYNKIYLPPILHEEEENISFVLKKNLII